MDNKRKIVLHKLGFDLNLIGAQYFSDIVSEVIPDIENNNTAEDINQTIEIAYLEYGHFVYEVGVNNFKNEVHKFHNSINRKSIDKDLYYEIYHGKKPTLNNSIVSIAKYLIKEKNKVEVPKVLLK